VAACVLVDRAVGTGWALVLDSWTVFTIVDVVGLGEVADKTLAEVVVSGASEVLAEVNGELEVDIMLLELTSELDPGFAELEAVLKCVAELVETVAVDTEFGKVEVVEARMSLLLVVDDPWVAKGKILAVSERDEEAIFEVE